jgi:hypothetical protein
VSSRAISIVEPGRFGFTHTPEAIHLNHNNDINASVTIRDADGVKVARCEVTSVLKPKRHPECQDSQTQGKALVARPHQL